MTALSSQRTETEADNLPRRARGLAPLLPLAAGVLCYLALPDRDLWPLGLVALAPLILFSLGSGEGRSFAGGFIAGLLLYVTAIPWVMNVMTEYGGLDAITSVLVMLLLHSYLAVYYGLFAWLVSRTSATSESAALATAPLLFAGLEWLRGWLFSGFPWIPLALSQWQGNLPLVQHAAWGGAYSVSGLCAAASAGAVGLCRPRARRVGAALLALVALAEISGWLWLRGWDARIARMPRRFKVGVVQAMVPLEEKWDPSFRKPIEELHYTMSYDLRKQGADAIVWSESSIPVPGGFFGDLEYHRKLKDLCRSLGRPLIFGGTSRETHEGQELIYNSAFALSADGDPAGRYDKQHLVPFGEYVPLQRYLFFAKKLVREVGDFGRGVGPGLLPLGSVKAGVPICYEVIFPELCRSFALAGADLLVTITNDAWFGRTAAPEQHFAHTAFRAVESRRFLVRAANTGISGLVTPSGRVELRSAIFEHALFVAPVEPLTGLTLYDRYGDLIPALGLALAALAAVRRRGLAFGAPTRAR